MKKKSTGNGYVYSTDPNFNLETDDNEEALEKVSAVNQRIKVRLDKKHRAGKAVTLIESFTGTEEEKVDLGKKLKSYCGTGGSVKNGEILVQGDNRDKVLQWFYQNGYTSAKKI